MNKKDDGDNINCRTLGESPIKIWKESTFSKQAREIFINYASKLLKVHQKK
jgi:hypothetical protein